MLWLCFRKSGYNMGVIPCSRQEHTIYQKLSQTAGYSIYYFLIYRNYIFIARPHSSDHWRKELSLCHKNWFSYPYIFLTWWRKALIFQTKVILSNRIHSLKYLGSTTLGCKGIEIWKSKFVAKTQFLYSKYNVYSS